MEHLLPDGVRTGSSKGLPFSLSTGNSDEKVWCTHGKALCCQPRPQLLATSSTGLSAQHSSMMLPPTGARHIGHRPSRVRKSGAQAEQVHAWPHGWNNTEASAHQQTTHSWPAGCAAEAYAGAANPSPPGLHPALLLGLASCSDGPSGAEMLDAGSMTELCSITPHSAVLLNAGCWAVGVGGSGCRICNGCSKDAEDNPCSAEQRCSVLAAGCILAAEEAAACSAEAALSCS